IPIYYYKDLSKEEIIEKCKRPSFEDKEAFKIAEEIIEKIKELKMPIVFFVPPRHVNKLLEFISSKYPDYEIAVFKELTKINEEILFGKPCNIKIEGRGELIVIVKP
ncbi:MAG: hypothetical protein ACK4F9_06810, partial [Brevinematia bacterium]